MPAELTNLPADAGGSANLQPSTSLDDPANLNFYDPSEDNEEIETEQESAAEPVEADDEDQGQETEEAADETEDEAETEPDDEEGDEPDLSEGAEVKDDVQVTLKSGEKVALSELKSGYMMQADYTRKTQELSTKTQELSTKTRDLEALSTRVTRSVDAIAQLLTASVPPMPDQALAFTDPQRHYREKHLHETAMAKVAQVIGQANEPRAALKQLSEEQHNDLLRVESAKLAEAFPQTSTADGRRSFLENAASVAKELGYTDAEISQATDHRLFKLAYYARLGMQAEKAKAKAKQKVADVPPVAPARRQPSASANAARRNQDAMKKLNRTGSIHDAVKVDFE